MAGTVVHDITIRQGANFYWTFSLEDTSEQAITTLSTARMKGRTRKGVSATIFDWSSSGGEMTVDATAGSVTVDVSAATTAALDYADGEIGVYDVEVVETDGTVHRVFEGKLHFSREVTR